MRASLAQPLNICLMCELRNEYTHHLITGALAQRGLNAALVDEDGRVGSALRWQSRGPGLPFAIWEPDEVRRESLRSLDALIIDTEGRPRRRDLRALAARADLILVPSGTSALELDATKELMLFLSKELGASAYRRSMAVLTRVPPTGGGGEAAREQLHSLGLQVAQTAVRHYAAYQKATEQGILCRDVRENGPLAPGLIC